MTLFIGFTISRLLQEPVPQSSWIHFDVQLTLDDSDGRISVNSRLGEIETNGVETLDEQAELMTRLEIGISQIGPATDVGQKIFIDNFQVSADPDRN